MDMLPQVDEFLKTLADANRLRILKLLEKQDLCVCEIAHILGISQPAISKHLRKLYDIGLVSCKKSGFWTDYILEDVAKSYKNILTHVLLCLEQDKVILRDRKLLRQTDREKLCQCK